MFWNQELLIEILTYSTWGIIIFSGAIMLVLVLRRIYLILRKKKTDKWEKVNLEIILSYLEGNLTKKEIRLHLEKNSQQISFFTQICIDLIEDLKGEKEDDLKQLFSIGIIQNFYKTKLENGGLSETSEALKVFSFFEILDEETTVFILSFLSHKNLKVRFAAATALLKAGKVNIQIEVLKSLCQSKDISKIMLLELLIIFSKSETANFETKGRILKVLIMENQLPTKNRCVLIMAVGELQFLDQAPALFQLLAALIKKENMLDKKPEAGALVESLGKLRYYDILPLILKYSKDFGSAFKISCIKALGSLGGIKSIKLLDHFLIDKDEEIQLEAIKQLLEIGEPALAYLSNSSFKESIRYNTLKELQEIDMHHV